MSDSGNEDIHEYDIYPDPSPARPVNPVTFFAPGASHADKDFRPNVTHVFSNDDIQEEVSEEEQSEREETKARHPSQTREQQPYERKLDEQTQSTTNVEEPKEAPGIAGPKQGQPKEE